jgi:calcium-independent phospholipase A2-gamma
MACLYMLYIEKFLLEKPLNNNKRVGITTERRELLKRFGNWVQCQCDRPCGLEWNFGNDIGLHRKGDTRECAIMKLFKRQSVMKMSVEKESAFWRLTRKKWVESEVQ